MAVKIQSGMNAIDAAMVSAGSAEDVFAFCLLNGIGLTDELTPGSSLQTTGQTYQAASIITNPQISAKPVAVMPGQTLLDLAMQQLGSVEACFALGLLNNINLTADLTAGAAINYSIMPYNKTVKKIYADNQYKPASGLQIPGPGLPTLLSGIDYWALEYDFVVQ